MKPLKSRRLTRTVADRVYTYESVPAYNPDSFLLEGYDLIPLDGGPAVFIPTSKELPHHLLDQKLYEFIDENHDKFITRTNSQWLDPVSALILANNDSVDFLLYDAVIPVDEKDLDQQGVHQAEDFYDLEGRSKGKQKPGGSTTVTKEDMSCISDHDKTGWTSGMQPSSAPDRDTWDAPGSSAPEGALWGLTPSYSSVTRMVINLHRSASKAIDQWALSSSVGFGDFIAGLPATLARYKTCGISKDNAITSIRKINSALFSVNPWAESMVHRFADQVYGTQKKAKCSVESITAGIEDLVGSLYAAGLDRSAVLAQVNEEFASWVENDPETEHFVAACVDRKYGIKIAPDDKLEQYRKIRLLSSPEVDGIVIDVSDGEPSLTSVLVFWLNPPPAFPEISEVSAEDVVLVGNATPAEIRLAKEVSGQDLAKLSIKFTPNYYINIFSSQTENLPADYAGFLNWCRAAKVAPASIPELERIALSLGLIKISDCLEIVAEKDVYVSDDKSDARTIEMDPDPSKRPAKIVTQDGKELKKVDM